MISSIMNEKSIVHCELEAYLESDFMTCIATHHFLLVKTDEKNEGVSDVSRSGTNICLIDSWVDWRKPRICYNGIEMIKKIFLSVGSENSLNLFYDIFEISGKNLNPIAGDIKLSKIEGYFIQLYTYK